MSKYPLLRLLAIFILVLSACRTSTTPQQTAAPEVGEPAAEQPAAEQENNANQGAETAVENPPTSDSEPPAAESSSPAASNQALNSGLGPEALPSGPLTLLTLGDSLTEGSGDYDLGIGYPGRLINLINTLRPGSILKNFGHSGWSSNDLISGNSDAQSQLQEALKAALEAQAAGQPALAIVWIGSNDLWYLYEYGPEPMTAEAEDADLENFRHNIQTILSELHAAGAAVFIAQGDDQSLRPVVVSPPNPSEPAFPSISAEDRLRMSAQIERYNQVIAEAASQTGAGVVDFYHTSIFTDPATLADDGNHPNSPGYDRIAEIWFQAIQTVLP